jgi:hypothetical protein
MKKQIEDARLKVWERILYIFVFAAFTTIRIPSVLTSGRFWAEEGTVFFVNAWYQNWHNALFASYGGYMAICANLAGVLAKYLVPLEYACYVPTVFALVIQIMPAILLCTSKQAWLQDRKILITSLLLVVSMPFSYEVWLSSIGSQCHLNLCVILILALETTTGLVAFFRYSLLLLAPLSGPGPIFLLPLFIARAVIERSKPRAIQAAVLGLASAVQIVLSFLYAQPRQLGTSLVVLINTIFLKHILEPLVGLVYPLHLTRHLHDVLTGGPTSIAIAIFTVVIFGLFGTIAWKAGNAPPIWLFLSALALSTVSYFGAWGIVRTDLLYAGFADRYAFAPQVSFELALLCLSCMTKGWTRSICRVIVAWILVIGLLSYFSIPIGFSNGPSWSSEVKAWRKDPRHPLKIWPYPWYIQLAPL